MLELKYVDKWYDSTRLSLYLNELSIPTGEVVGILGANGSGKTTLLKAIAGLGEIQNGEIRLNGKPVQEQYENLAYMTEEGSFPPDLTPHEYGSFLSEFFTQFDMDYYKKLLAYFELEPDQRIRKFSRGQKSKLEICAGFSKKASCILMDEPFLGKDMFSRRDFLKLMIANLDGSETLLIATHIIDEIEHVLDRAIILHDGRVKTDVYIDDLRQQGKSLTDVMAEASGYRDNSYKKVYQESLLHKNHRNE